MAASPISFARGAPAPELIPAAELADCAHAVALRDGARVFAYGPGGGYGPLREWVAERHGVEPGRVVLTVGGLHGFVLYVAEALARRPGRVLVEGPTYDRPLKILAQRVRRGGGARHGRGRTRPGRPGARASANARPAFVPVHDPDLPESQRADALGRATAAHRRDRRTARAPGARRRPVRARSLRGRTGDDAARADAKASSSLTRPRSRRPSRRGSERGTSCSRLRKPRHSRSERSRRTSHRRFSLRPRSPSSWSAGASNRIWSAFARELRARRDAMIASLERTFHEDASWNRPEGGYFIWLELGDRRRRLRARGARRRERRRHRAGPRLLPARVECRQLVGAACVQLRDAGANRRGRRASCGAALATTSRRAARRARERSKRNPPAKPIATQRMMRNSRRVEVEKKRKSTRDLLAVLERDHDGVEGEHSEDDQRPRSVALLRRRGRVGPFHEGNPTRRDRPRRAEAGAGRAGAASVARERRLALRGRSGTADSREERRGSRVGSNSRRRWRVSVSSSSSKAAPQRPARILSSGSGSYKPQADKSPAICACSQIGKNTCKFSNFLADVVSVCNAC